MFIKKYGLIGSKLNHSFSKKFFNDYFQSNNINDSVYDNYELSNISELKKLIDSNPDLFGLNVTIPYKENVLKYVDNVSDEVNKIGAANTLLIKNNIISAYNTDYYGFEKMIKPFLDSNHTDALIIGCGGASKAVEFVLKKIGITVRKVCRNNVNADFNFDELNNYIIKFHKLIINTTPIGMYPYIDEYPLINYDIIDENYLCIDLIYNPEETLFLKKCSSKNAKTLNGQQMLEFQAIKSYKIWTNN